MEGKTIEELIEMIIGEDTPPYDITEAALNSFGYDLIGQKKMKDAPKIFKLNTELYPDAWRTHDSYGECLLKKGDKENRIKAYQKLLELYPDNPYAKEALSEKE